MMRLPKLLSMLVTLLACAFLLVPTLQSVLAGITANYFRGISSGLTLKWVIEVWTLYAEVFSSPSGGVTCLAVTPFWACRSLCAGPKPRSSVAGS